METADVPQTPTPNPPRQALTVVQVTEQALALAAKDEAWARKFLSPTESAVGGLACLSALCFIGSIGGLIATVITGGATIPIAIGACSLFTAAGAVLFHQVKEEEAQEIIRIADSRRETLRLCAPKLERVITIDPQFFPETVKMLVADEESQKNAQAAPPNEQPAEPVELPRVGLPWVPPPDDQARPAEEPGVDQRALRPLLAHLQEPSTAGGTAGSNTGSAAIAARLLLRMKKNARPNLGPGSGPGA